MFSTFKRFPVSFFLIFVERKHCPPSFGGGGGGGVRSEELGALSRQVKGGWCNWSGKRGSQVTISPYRAPTVGTMRELN